MEIDNFCVIIGAARLDSDRSCDTDRKCAASIRAPELWQGWSGWTSGDGDAGARFRLWRRWGQKKFLRLLKRKARLSGTAVGFGSDDSATEYDQAVPPMYYKIESVWLYVYVVVLSVLPTCYISHQRLPIPQFLLPGILIHQPVRWPSWWQRRVNSIGIWSRLSECSGWRRDSRPSRRR